MTEFTTNLHFSLVDFNVATWHDEVNDNFRSIDAILNAFTGLTGILGPWQNSTLYTVGQRVIDIDLDSLWEVAIQHTSAAAGTFAAYRAAHPTHWTLVTAGIPNPYNVPGNFSVAGTSVLNGAVRIGANVPQSNATLSNRKSGNAFEWGHTSASGYRSVIGADIAGYSWIGFYIEAGTTANTYMTRGLRGTVIKGDTAGGVQFEDVPNANADDQVSVVFADLSTLGSKLRGVGAAGGNAAAGDIGEVISAQVLSGAGIALTTGVAKDVTSIALTAGDWDVVGTVGFTTAGTTSVTLIQQSISQTLDTLDVTPGAFQARGFAAIVPGVSSLFFVMGANRIRISLAATTTIHLVAQAVFTVAALTAYGRIEARRAR